jgi:hypothetical protein
MTGRLYITSRRMLLPLENQKRLLKKRGFGIYVKKPWD